MVFWRKNKMVTKTRAIGISMSDDDILYLNERRLKPSAVMRAAVAHLRSGELEVSDGFFIDPIAELVKLRNAMQMQLGTIKDLEREIAEFKSAK